MSSPAAVQTAMQLTGNLIHDDDLYGGDLQHAEELYDVLEDAEAKLMALQHTLPGEGKDNEDAPASKKMRFE